MTHAEMFVHAKTLEREVETLKEWQQTAIKMIFAAGGHAAEQMMTIAALKTRLAITQDEAMGLLRVLDAHLARTNFGALKRKANTDDLIALRARLRNFVAGREDGIPGTIVEHDRGGKVTQTVIPRRKK